MKTKTPYSGWKALVVGGGSIGRRHLANLKLCGVTELAVVEPQSDRVADLMSESAKVFSSLSQGLEWSPDLALVATPTHLHLSQAKEIVQAGVPVFIEKPLSDSDAGITELISLIGNNKLPTMVGCNMRFHPGPAKIKQLLLEGAIGRVYFSRIHTGSYLPEWRKGQDYRQSYSAKLSQGGGCLLDCIHEIDLASWYQGSISEVFCRAAHVSNLEIDVEDVALLICEHRGGSLSQIELDYVQRNYDRGCHIVGEKGSLTWDFSNGTVTLQKVGSEKQTFQQPSDWQLNQMYVDSLYHFLECIEAGTTPMNSVKEAAEVLRVVLAAKTSSKTRSMSVITSAASVIASEATCPAEPERSRKQSRT
jgi:predicted dehydrogenase